VLAGLAVLTLVAAVGVLLAPVTAQDPVVSWPPAGKPVRSTVLPLSPYRPLRLDATVPCAALAPLLAQAPADVVVIERTRAFAIAVGDDREIYRFFIYRDPTLPDVYFLASAQAQVDRMQPSHTEGTVVESINFLCDDPHSLCDRDLLGA